MAVQFKQKCWRCKKNYVITTKNQRFVTCFECQKKDIDKEVTDPAMKELLEIPEEFYKNNSFLRDIKIKYHEYGNLSEKQIEAFKNTVKKMKEGKKETKEN